MGLIGRLIANTFVGLVLLFLTNLFLSDEVPLNVLTIVICAIGGVVGSDRPIKPATHGCHNADGKIPSGTSCQIALV